MRWSLILIITIISALFTANSAIGENQPLTDVPASTLAQTTETTPNIGCQGCSECKTANINGISMPFHEFPFVLVALALFVLLVVKKHKRTVLFWAVGLTLFLGLAVSLAQQQKSPNGTSPQSTTGTLQTSTKDSKAPATTSTIDSTEEDEFLPVEGNDEFQPFTKSDEFQPIRRVETENANRWFSEGEARNLTRTLIALLAAVIAGFAFRFSKGRNFKNVFLLASLVYLGFYSNGCPCMISSLQNLVLFLLGEPTQWVSLVWILGLLPITYFFGKIWCGWVCHLGAVQEFLYLPGKAKILLNPSAQKAFKIIRLATFITLIVQLIITRTNLYIKIDPFKVIFNLYSSNLTGWVLLGILLLSSLLVYRPFCRAFCPVGLLLGWVEKIPGASKLQTNASCKNCNQCYKKCNYQAIIVAKHQTTIDNSECIRCGDCIDTCRFGAIKKK